MARPSKKRAKLAKVDVDDELWRVVRRLSALGAMLSTSEGGPILNRLALQGLALMLYEVAKSVALVHEEINRRNVA